jgi:hypothetical protein
MFKKTRARVLFLDVIRGVIRRVSPVRRFATLIHGFLLNRSQTTPHAKRTLIRDLLREHPRSIAIETGTYLGDTTLLLSKKCRSVTSIEFSPELARKARERFRRSDGVVIVEGDSGQCLADILSPQVDDVFFWLDAHYSAGITSGLPNLAPLAQEIEVIANWSTGKQFTIAIDDAHELGSIGYPSEEEVRSLILSQTLGIWRRNGNVLVFVSGVSS